LQQNPQVREDDFTVRSRAALEICGWGPRLGGLEDGSSPVGSRGHSRGLEDKEAEALSENRYYFLSKITAKWYLISVI